MFFNNYNFSIFFSIIYRIKFLFENIKKSSYNLLDSLTLYILGWESRGIGWSEGFRRMGGARGFRRMGGTDLKIVVYLFTICINQLNNQIGSTIEQMLG